MKFILSCSNKDAEYIEQNIRDKNNNMCVAF